MKKLFLVLSLTSLLFNSVSASGSLQEITIKDPGSSSYTINVTTIISDVTTVRNTINSKECKKEGESQTIDGELVFSNSKICEYLSRKTQYLKFLDELKNNPKSYKYINSVIFGGIAQFMAWENPALTTNNILIHSQSGNGNGVVGIERMYGGDLPGYYLVRLFMRDGKIIYQQAEIIPYEKLYSNTGDENVTSMLNQFDANLKKAVKNGWKFKSKEFNSRFTGLMNTFEQEANKALKQ